MAATFSHSLRVLNTDGSHPSIMGLLLTTAVLGSWVGWAFFARVTLYEVTDTARLEVGREVHPIQVSAAGRVVATRLTLGGEVQAGDVLVELDTEAERHRLEEERASLATLSAQLDGLRKEAVAEEQAGDEDQQTARAALDEARVQAKGAETAVPFAEEEVKRLTRLQAAGYVAELDLLRAQAEAQKRRTTADALRLEVSHLAKDQRTKKSDRKVRFERLNREVGRLEGQLATTTEVIERLAYEMEKRRIRAPAAGRLGEVANLRIGAFVLEGDRLGAIVPQGELRAVAHFLPPPALGRIQPGQPARDAPRWLSLDPVRDHCGDGRECRERDPGRAGAGRTHGPPGSHFSNPFPTRLTRRGRGRGRSRLTGNAPVASRREVSSQTDPPAGFTECACGELVTPDPSRTRRRLLVPEVVQTSAMDCGPASLKCLLEGFGISASYGRLREACQTDVDGTSIDTMEEVAVQLGLDAEQIMVPVDHLLLPEARVLPAIVVVRLPSGITHFVVAWRRHGHFVQVMDPATGRRWPTCRRFLGEIYVHTTPVPAPAWREWAGSGEFLSTLRRRLANRGSQRA
ncbi:MAG TPA: cysteine peptidase family C39 domain-containing protein [Candidatus Binatia bacterium]|nr:cysteine peptidase family C39 domain-containing protein [Candidatus Binatia bacterium]